MISAFGSLEVLRDWWLGPLDEIPVRAWVSEAVGAPGQLDAVLAQFLCPLRGGGLEVDLHSTGRSALPVPRLLAAPEVPRPSATTPLES
jgi:hypothetical protein